MEKRDRLIILADVTGKKWGQALRVDHQHVRPDPKLPISF